MPATILSRTQHFRFKPISIQNIVHHLEFILSKEGIKYEIDALNILARAGEGSLRDTLTLLDQAIIFTHENISATQIADMLGILDPAKIDEIMQICSKYEIAVIEDAAEALGARFNDKALGCFGSFGAYSFNGNKIITCGGGGMLISNDENLLSHARYLSTQAREPLLYYEHKQNGYNYRPSNVLGAIGLGQMELLDERIKRKREIFELYKSELGDVADFMPEIARGRGNRWLSTLAFKQKGAHLRVIDALNQANIESRPLWKPMHTQSVFSGAKAVLNGTSDDLFARGLCLPSGANMSDEMVLKIAKIIKSAL